MSQRLQGLYVIADPQAAAGRDLRDVIAAAVHGGASVVQLRDKVSPKGRQLAVARELLEVCRAQGALFIVNDHVDVALAVGADGVHVGQQDLPVDVVRRITPQGFIVGCSANNGAEALQAQAAGADYVSVGRLYPTDSKLDTRPATLATLRAVKRALSVPVCAIGGINAQNIGAVAEAGADMAAVIAAVLLAADPEAAARDLSARFQAKRPGR